MIIKKFESFNNEIGAISKFISSMNDNNSIRFINDILEISGTIDIPASTITGEYMSSRKSFLLESKDVPASDNYLKFWFSLKSGYIGKTISLKNSLSPLSSSILHKNKILNTFQLEKLSKIYETGKLEIINDLEVLKNGDKVIYIHSEGYDPLDAIIYTNKDNIYILQDRFKSESTHVVSKDLLNMLKKYDKSDYLTISYGSYIILKYVECDSKIYQDVSSVNKLILEKIKFINNNKICSNNLRTKNWEDLSYAQIRDSDYSLVLDLGNLGDKTKLSSIRSERDDNKPLPTNDDYYRKTNIRNYERILKRSINSKENERKIEKIVYHIKMSIYGYRNMRDVDMTLLDKMVEICKEGKITISQFEDMVNKFF